jgi:hypothetical protein
MSHIHTHLGHLPILYLNTIPSRTQLLWLRAHMFTAHNPVLDSEGDICNVQPNCSYGNHNMDKMLTNNIILASRVYNGSSDQNYLDTQI